MFIHIALYCSCTTRKYIQDTSSQYDGTGKEDGSDVLSSNYPQPRSTRLVVDVIPILSRHQLHVYICNIYNTLSKL